MHKTLFSTAITIFLLGSHAFAAPEITNIFPPQQLHVHGATITECPNGDILAAWFEGTGERWADDVKIMGARLEYGEREWSPPFLMADTPGFPDINPVLFVDRDEDLWLVWYTVLANQWETSLLKFRKSSDYLEAGKSPTWYWQDNILVKPGDPAERGIQPDDPFVESVKQQLSRLDERYRKRADALAPAERKGLMELWSRRKEDLIEKAEGRNMIKSGRLRGEDGQQTEALLGYPYFRRMGWQTRNKPYQSGQRIILPLYSDGFSFSLMAITENFGKTWSFSEPLVENGNIQPALASRANGELVAYMRDNGPAPKRLHVSESSDLGDTWSVVEDSSIPNPGSGADIANLADGSWILMYNDTETGRHSLAVSISQDEGKTWSDPKHIELDQRGDEAARSHYPALIQGKDGRIHAVYSYHRNEGPESERKTIRYAVFSEDWAEGQN